MPINFNGTNIDKIIYNETTLDKVIYNGVVVWESVRALVMDATGIEEAIRIIFTNPNNYEANVTVILDYDYSQEWNVKVPANGEKELVINDLIAGPYEVLVSYYINDKHFQDYADVQVSRRPGPQASEISYLFNTGNHDTGQCFVKVNNNSNYGIKANVIIDSVRGTSDYTLNIAAHDWEKTLPALSIDGGSKVTMNLKCYYNGRIFYEKTQTGYIDESSTTTTAYALGEPTSTEGNFKYYQGGKNARPINK